VAISAKEVLDGFAEDFGVDLTPIVIEALATELVRTSILLEELLERIEWHGIQQPSDEQIEEWREQNAAAEAAVIAVLNRR